MAAPRHVTAAAVAFAMQAELRELARLERAESFEGRRDRGAGSPSHRRRSDSPGRKTEECVVMLPAGAEAASHTRAPAGPVHGSARKPRTPRRMRRRSSARSKRRPRARDSFSVTSALSQSVAGGGARNAQGLRVHTALRDGGHVSPRLGARTRGRRNSEPGVTSPLSAINGSSSTVGGASVASTPVVMPAMASRAVMDYVPLGCLAGDNASVTSTPQRSILITMSSSADGYSTGGRSCSDFDSESGTATDATTWHCSDMGDGGGEDEDGSPVGMPLVIEVITCTAGPSGSGGRSGAQCASRQRSCASRGPSGYDSSGAEEGGSFVASAEHGSAGVTEVRPVSAAWLAPTPAVGDAESSRQRSPTLTGHSVTRGVSSWRADYGQPGAGSPSSCTSGEPAAWTRGSGTQGGHAPHSSGHSPASHPSDVASNGCAGGSGVSQPQAVAMGAGEGGAASAVGVGRSAVTDGGSSDDADTGDSAADVEREETAAATGVSPVPTPSRARSTAQSACNLRPARRALGATPHNTPPLRAVLASTPGFDKSLRTLSLDSMDDTTAATTPSTAHKRFDFSTMPRVSVEIWDDVVDDHVRCVFTADSSHDDTLSPLSEPGDKEAQRGCCSSWCKSIERGLRRLKSATAPGTRPSRWVYEQLKWAPILVGMLLVLVPLSLDGETLNRFTFSLPFQGLHFVVTLAFAFATFGLLYPLPPTKHLVIYTACSTTAYVTLVALAMSYLSGRTLRFVLPAILVFMGSFLIAFLLHSAIATCVVQVTPGSHARKPSTWAVITGRVPIHTRKRPVVGRGSMSSVASPQADTFVLNAEALLPLRRLFIAQGVVAVTYYWFQLYTRVLASDLGFGIATVLVFELALFCLRRVMRKVVDRRQLVRVGIPETSARAISTVMSYTVVLCGAFFERLLFLGSDSRASVEIVVVQRTLIHLAIDLVTMSKWYFKLRTKVMVSLTKRCRRSTEEPNMRGYDEYLYDQHVINMWAHVANFTSLASWGIALAWFRFGYNAPVFPFAGVDLSNDDFLRLLSYGLVLALAEFFELLVVRGLAMCGRKKRVRYFNRALQPMLHWAARFAFVAASAHVLQDAMVAIVQLEPNRA